MYYCRMIGELPESNAVLPFPSAAIEEWCCLVSLREGGT